MFERLAGKIMWSTAPWVARQPAVTRAPKRPVCRSRHGQETNSLGHVSAPGLSSFRCSAIISCWLRPNAVF